MGSLASGIPGLDLVLGGGLDPGSLVVVAGSPGTGKTITAQQICFSLATSSRPALYYTTLSEPHTKLVQHLESFSFFDLEALERRVEFLNLAALFGEESGAGSDALFDEVIRHVYETNPSVVVIDSSKALRDLTRGDTLRRQVYELASKVAHTSAVLILVGEYTEAEMDALPEFAVADTIIRLARESEGPVDRPWLRVVKARGAAPLQGQHSFHIGSDGATVFPRLESTLPARGALSRERISIGVPAIDALAHGGLPAGDATLLLGPSGVGKTILALRFLGQGLDQGEQGVFVSFQETQTQLLARAAGFGWDFAAPLASGQLQILAIPPVELDLDVVGQALLERVHAMEGGRVVLDSLAELAFAARQTERLPAYAWSITALASARGASTLITNETALLGTATGLVSGLAFLFHNMILMRFLESESRLSRAIAVLKMRDSDHEKTHVEFAITDAGIEVGEPLTGLKGALGFSSLTIDPQSDKTP